MGRKVVTMIKQYVKCDQCGIEQDVDSTKYYIVDVVSHETFNVKHYHICKECGRQGMKILEC